MNYSFSIPGQNNTGFLFAVSLSERGVSGIDFILVRKTRAAVPPQEKRSKSSALLACLKKSLSNYLKGKPEDFSGIPLDMSSATQFQSLVWLQARKIQGGSTCSYKDLAALCGTKKAARAVGNALNKNPFPILVPCHRITASNGALGGYAKGAKIKKVLLNLESGLNYQKKKALCQELGRTGR